MTVISYTIGCDWPSCGVQAGSAASLHEAKDLATAAGFYSHPWIGAYCAGHRVREAGGHE